MFRPLRDVILLELEPAVETTQGGIIRPLVRQNPARIGKVLRTGPGRHWRNKQTGKMEFWPMQVKEGDRVLFPAALLDVTQGKRQAEFLDDNQALIRETDVLLVIDSDEKLDVEL